jgi:hypothetical protein
MDSTTRTAKDNPSTPQIKTASVGCVRTPVIGTIYKAASREQSLSEINKEN